MTRVLRTKLPNGKIVELQTDSTTSWVDPASMNHRDKLLALLKSSATSENEIRRYLASICPAIFPSADPASLPVMEPTIWHGSRADIGFAIVNSDKIGVVDTKLPKRDPKIIEVLFDLGRLTSAIFSSGISSSLAEYHIIADLPSFMQSQSEVVRDSVSGSTIAVELLTWNDVLNRLSAPTDDASFSIILLEIVNSSRRLLAELLKNSNLLFGIDDRRFEELVATMLSDIGFQEVTLTPPRKDGGKDVIAVHINPKTGNKEIYYFECKHWVLGGKVNLKIATTLGDIVKRDNATAGIIVSSSGFGPKLVEQEATINKKNVYLKDAFEVKRWIEIWGRTYGSVLLEPIDPISLVGL